MSRTVLPHMRKRGSGLLIYVSSGAGRLVSRVTEMCGTCEFALEALAESSHYQLAPKGIDTVIVQPGPHATCAGDNLHAPQDLERAEGYGEHGRLILDATVLLVDRFHHPETPNP